MSCDEYLLLKHNYSFMQANHLLLSVVRIWFLYSENTVVCDGKELSLTDKETI